MLGALAAITTTVATPTAHAQTPPPSPPVFSVATATGPLTATESDLAHWLHISRRTSTQPGATLQALQLDAMDTLLNGAYLRAEAAEQHVSVTDRQVSRSLNRQRHHLFGSLKDYRRYLVVTGQTRADLLERTRQDLIAGRLRDRVTAPAAAAVTPAIVQAYVKTHPRFIPERRDALVIFTAHRQQADAAHRELAGGANFPGVAQRYSLDEVSKARGGLMPKLSRTNVEPALATALFRSHTGRLEGPVHTKFGYYVFAVVRVYPRREVTQARQLQTATLKLKTEAQSRALNAYSEAFNARWAARTTCAPRFAFNPRCANHT